MEYPKFDGGLHFNWFEQKTPVLGKFGPKRQNYLFKMKSSATIMSNMLNMMAIFKFSVLGCK